MFGKKMIKWWLTQLIIIYPCSNVFSLETIKPNHPYFQYTGRIDFSVPDKPVLYWPGTYIRANFEGSILILLLDDKTGQSYYNVFIDDDYVNPRIIDCRAGSNVYVVSTSLADTKHSFLLFRRTEASTGPTKFLGIHLNDGKTLLEPPPRPQRKILFYGNSITCGMGNEAPDNSGDDDMAHENNFLAYGAIASRLLHADYMCIAKSGIGIMISWFPMVMSQYYYRLDPDNPDSHWDFNLYIPDVVVINLFQNDSWLIHKLQPKPDSAQITNAYINFVREIRSRHPNAFIVCSLGSMDATRVGSPWPGYIENAVAYIKHADNDTNITTYFFPFDPRWTKHPRVRHHQVMGQNLADFIKVKMGWNTSVKPEKKTIVPNGFGLLQNYPNPFKHRTLISYQLPISSQVEVSIYNVLGQKITTLVSQNQVSGIYKLNWDASGLAEGIYLCRLKAGGFTQCQRLLLMH